MSAGSKKSDGLDEGTCAVMETTMLEEGFFAPSTGSGGGVNDVGNKKQLESLCRVCANTSDYFIPIFEGEGLEHQLDMKIQKHLPIQVLEVDNLPAHVCYQCASTLIAWHDLVTACVEADKKLHRLLQEEADEEFGGDHDEKVVEFFNEPPVDSDGADDFSEPSTSAVVAELKESLPPQKRKPAGKGKRKVHESASSERDAKVNTVPADSKDACTGQKEGVESASSTERYERKSVEMPNHDDLSLKQDDVHLSPTDCLSDESNDKTIAMQFDVTNEESISGVEGTAAAIHSPKNRSSCKKPLKYFRSSKSPWSERVGNMCHVCNKKYSTRKSLKEHVKKHFQPRAKCDMCGKVYKNEHVLRTHIRLHLGKQPRPCRLCDKAFVFASSLKQHMREEHREVVELRCATCGKVCSSRYRLKVHVTSHDPERHASMLHICQACGRSFKKLQSLKIHEQQVHLAVPKQHICERCGAMFHSISKLKVHMLKHTGERPFTCETCGLCFGTRHRLNNHLVCHSEARPHSCHVCGKTFKRQRNLGMHEQNSHGIFSRGTGQEKVVMNFPCHVCERQFTTRQKLTAHMRNHTGEKPFRCETCCRNYRTSAGLGFHKKTVHVASEGKPVSKYIQNALRKDFPCEICGKVISSKVGLDNHIRTHTGERPYKCKLCTLALKTPAQLHAHMQTHSNCKPFACSFCEKNFRRKPHLVSHLRTHTGEKPYSCDVCGRAFSQKGDMKKHKLKLHNVAVNINDPLLVPIIGPLL